MSTEMPRPLESGSVSPRPRKASVKVRAEPVRVRVSAVTLYHCFIVSVYLYSVVTRKFKPLNRV
jgi:hypothetical protein